jgi:hypothetical protein
MLEFQGVVSAPMLVSGDFQNKTIHGQHSSGTDANSIMTPDSLALFSTASTTNRETKPRNEASANVTSYFAQ